MDAKERVNKEVAKIKKKQKGRFDIDRIDSPFKQSDIVWWKAEAKTLRRE